MTTDRRTFLQASLAAGALLAARAHADEQPKQAAARAPKKILILGGTQFVGPALVEAARARGHVITLFNRGKTNAELFPELEKLRGDRDPKKDAGLAALKGRKWDAVIDDCGYYPRHVAASTDLLAESVGRYVFVSSTSAYARNDIEGIDETADVAKLADPSVETMGDGYEHYGGLKALCEKAVESAFADRATIVRPGYIVGPGDPTDRFTYWPVRIAKGDDVIVPGEPTDPIQVIDVRDLAAWMIALVEGNVRGTFNAVGPERRLSWGEVLEACRNASGVQTRLRFLSVPELRARGVVDDMPIWAPYEGETKGYHTASNARARAAGLTFRPIAKTVADTLAWFQSLPAERRADLQAGLDPKKEAEILRSL
ncbi:MAG: NAD-dependent epimerase/dehydratase family protein [Planctomycetota bacterium]